MNLLTVIVNALSSKSEWEYKREILKEFSKTYTIVPLKRGERPHWWHVIHINGERYYVQGCDDIEFKRIVREVKLRYKGARVTVKGELATPTGRPVRI